MGALEPISEKVTEEGRALAESLRTLFESLGISVRRYAARCHTDPGNVSRYLNGTRVPPWNFVKELLAHVADHRDQQTSDEAVALLRELYVRALGTGNNTRRVQELQHLLEEADRQVLEAAALERLLRRALQEQQQQVAQLNAELQSARAARAMDRQAAGTEVELYDGCLDDIRSERDQLRIEVELLRKQLAEATAARMLAEERCTQLEHQIEGAEKHEREAERAQAERERIELEREAEQAAEEFAAAQERIAKLQVELVDARRKKTQPTSPDPNASLVDSIKMGDGTAETLAGRLGFGPHQVLRRVDSARRLAPGRTEEILKKALDLQTPEEAALTTELLHSMPNSVRETFQDLVSKAAGFRAAPPLS